MIDQLVEKYLNSMKWDNKVYDIFVNPTKQEIKELEDNPYSSYRFIADMKTKTLYAFSYELIHNWIISEYSFEYFDHLSYASYVNEGIDADRYFFGHIENGRLESDTWRGFEWRMGRESGSDIKIENIMKMQKHNKSWLSKYGIPPSSVQKMVDVVIKAYEKGRKK